jgi:hypothetical protein
MPFWGWVVLIAGLSAFAVASIFAIVHHTHRRLPARQVAEGDPMDLSAPLPKHIHEEFDVMTERQLEAEREPERPRA